MDTSYISTYRTAVWGSSLNRLVQTNIWEEYLTPNLPVREFFAMTGAGSDGLRTGD